MTYIKDHPIEFKETLRLIRKSDCIQSDGKLGWPEIFFIESTRRNCIEEHHKHKGYNPQRWRDHWMAGLIFVKPAVEIDNTNTY